MGEPEEIQSIDFDSTRALRYSELFLVGPEWIDVLNSIGLSEAPPELWDATDPAAAAEQLEVGTVIKNGPHWWAATSRDRGERRRLGGLGSPW